MVSVSKDVLNDNEGESIGSVSRYVKSFKDIESNKIESAPKPESYNKKETPTLTLPESWNPDTEKSILLHYCKRFGCLDLTDLDDKAGKITIAVNRTYHQKLTLEETKSKLEKNIKLDDLFEDLEDQTVEKNVTREKPVVEKNLKHFKVDIREGSYPYKKGLKQLTQEQLDLCRFINQKDLAFSSDENGIFLTIIPGKESSFDKLLNFSPKENLLFEMFREQLGDEHKAKKLVLMSRLMSETDTVQDISSENNKKKKKNS